MKTVLITGAVRRGGAAIARKIVGRGYRVILHCRPSSLPAAQALQRELLELHDQCAVTWARALERDMQAPPMRDSIVGIVANASTYAPSDLDSFNERLDEDIETHLAGHLQLIHLCKNALVHNRGAIVAITDIHVQRASKDYLTYHIAKGALDAAVRALAAELAPEVRVNAVAPGTLEWPATNPFTAEQKSSIVQSIPLGRVGRFEELASAVNFLLFDATYTTGTTITVDGGRSSFLE